ncbi:DUF5615 family PIN-like protein [Flavobacterium sp. PLA-1-15]|uniref:DUF5615 family PIN-like protein n=1 Tax=Flavobacterium sp. PLA-1-15 TaxID=3380533 RepID=UPI003B829F3E
MPKYLIDVKLPYHFSLWNSEDCIHQKDINDEWSDEQIWEYAKNKNLTIITKDVDFFNKMLLHTPPPKVIHIRFGNLKMKDFFDLTTKIWSHVLELNQKNKLVSVYMDRIEAID